ncbi:MAG: hypothetical protein A2X78_00090 [Gammaproteobacteria bacterium GWE2_37_16]|nr:MAG: hypothetical protein A2X78_00090 [Gammaproteobacteria bacterium GWE2_37_16]
MLLNFKVKNFRSIKEEIVLDLQATSDDAMKSDAVFNCGNVSLLKCAAIYGPNASGKSNIFKAFAVFRMMILESLLRSNTQVDLPNEFFKLSEDTENQSSRFEMTFLLDEDIFSYGFEIDKKSITAEWLKQKKGNKILFTRKKQEIKHNKNYFSEASGDLKKKTTERVLFLTLLASYDQPISKKTIQLIQKTGLISGAERANTLNYTIDQFLNNSSMAEKTKDFIVKADFGVADIKISKKIISAKEIKNIPDKFKELFFKEDSKIAEHSLIFFHKKYDKHGKEIASIPLNFFTEESDGTQQMFALSAPIIDALENGKILFIDELEANLHPVLCQYLVSIFNSKEKNPNNAQFIFTTHAVSLLDEDYLRRDEIYFMDRDEKGTTELFSLADISERKGVNFAKRYLEGRYKALPYIADFENLKFSKQV